MNSKTRVRNEVIEAEEQRGYEESEPVVRLSGLPLQAAKRLLIRVVLPLEKKTTPLLVLHGTC